jgi:acetate kinase
MSEIKNIVNAIKSINENAEFKFINTHLDSIKWLNGTTPISKADIEAKIAELPTEEEEKIARENLKASAKAKLIAGQPLTEEEADTIVL